MVKNVLVVDDDQELLLSLLEGLEKYGETFSVQLAGDGQIAVEKLKENAISLVVTDLKMPNMDGFGLLAHIMEQYPEIPVIVITAYSTPRMEKLAREGGAVGYIEKPFMVDSLARKIMTTLRKETEGGTLHGVSSGIFLQLIEMEQKTCTIRLTDKSSEKQGVLFFRDGELLDAKCDNMQGEFAAYEIFSWDETEISIQNSCSLKKKKINRDLQAILLEAMRLKDEADQRKEPVSEETEEDEAEEVTEIEEVEIPFNENAIRDKLEKEIGRNPGVEDIYEDGSWDGLIAQMSRIGTFFAAGKVKISYIDRGESKDFILLPGKTTTVLSVNPRCPKDRIIQILSG
jgi:CheY-like chemotaxis protein